MAEARDRVLEKASDTREKVEKAFDERLAGALGRLGIPTHRELDEMNRRLDTLTQVLQELTEQMKKDRQGR